MNTYVAIQQKTWQIDQAHSKIEFSVNHMMISYITGYFRKFEGSLISEADDFANSIVELSIDAKSIDTNHEQRDNHLKSPEFIDAENHPKITFKSSSIKTIDDNEYKITGDFTLRGITKEISLHVKYHGVIIDTYGNERAGFEVTSEINRKEFGVNWHQSLDNGGLVVGDYIKIKANVEVVHQQEAK